ncbi:hypothetical protein [Deinococcus hohokamensis]|uniref:Uncharacterized protein n=1 Tax=Deinococcus hohokamensis TaxID=309883 RepID=A0ABV9I5E0_9DEIO
MTDSSNRYGDRPLGKSVEEVEREGGNLTNPPVPGELRRDDDAPVVPAVIGGNASGVPGVAVSPVVLTDDADDRRD